MTPSWAERMRSYLGPALALRVAGPLLAVTSAALLLLARPELAMVRFVGVVAVMAIITLFVPREPFPTLVLVFLGGEYAVGTDRYAVAVRGVSALGAVIVLYGIHSAYALAAGLRVKVAIDPAVFRRFFKRTGETLAFALPTVAVTTLLGRHAPASEWFGALAILIALGLASTPLIIMRRRS